MVEEVRATARFPVWRRDEQGRPIGLQITDEGLKAIGPRPDHNSRPPSKGKKPTQRSRKSAARKPKEQTGHATSRKAHANSKQDKVIAMLRRPQGTTIQRRLAAFSVCRSWVDCIITPAGYDFRQAQDF